MWRAVWARPAPIAWSIWCGPKGPAAGLYGARITGGGSGGTVAVIGRKDASAAIARVADAYERATGYRPHVFSGSSPGVMAFGAQSITLVRRSHVVVSAFRSDHRS